MRIAVCDDEKEYLSETKNILDKFIFSSDFDVSADYFMSANELLEKDKYDLYLLDYLMPEMNGVELAGELKDKFSNITVCFLTTYETAAIDVINKNINAEAFLVKPVKETEIYNLLGKIARQGATGRIVIKKGKDNLVINSDDVIFIEVTNKTTVIHLVNSEIELNESITSVCEKYFNRKNFVKVHRSYVVNLSKIKKFDKNGVVMNNEVVIPCRKIKELKQAFDKLYFDSF